MFYPQVEVRVEGRAGRYEVAKDDVLLEADEAIDGPGQGGFGEDFGGFLEAGGRDKRLALQRCLGDAEQERLATGWLWLLGLGVIFAGGVGGFVGLLEL